MAIPHRIHRPDPWKLVQPSVSLSLDTVCITGFPTTISLEHIRDFFYLREGPCTCFYVPGVDMHCVAVRFNLPAVAQRVVSRYNNAIVGGFRIQVLLASYHMVTEYIQQNQQKPYFGKPQQVTNNVCQSSWQQGYYKNYANKRMPKEHKYTYNDQSKTSRKSKNPKVGNQRASCSKAVSKTKRKRRKNSSFQDKASKRKRRQDSMEEKRKFVEKEDLEIDLSGFETIADSPSPTDEDLEKLPSIEKGSSTRSSCKVGGNCASSKSGTFFQNPDAEALTKKDSVSCPKQEDIFAVESHDADLTLESKNEPGQNSQKDIDLREVSSHEKCGPGITVSESIETDRGLKEFKESAEHTREMNDEFSEKCEGEEPEAIHEKAPVGKHLGEKTTAAGGEMGRRKIKRPRRGIKKNLRKGLMRKKTGLESCQATAPGTSPTIASRDEEKERLLKVFELKKREIEQEYERECSNLLNVVKTLASKEPSLTEKLKELVRECLFELGDHLVKKLEPCVVEIRRTLAQNEI